MLNAIFVGIRFVILVLSGHRHVALENAALRQQLAVFKRDIKRPRLHRRDRLFWIGLRTIWKNWKSALVIVRPETVISWQRKRFKRYWWRLSQAKGPGRPRVSSDIRKLLAGVLRSEEHTSELQSPCNIVCRLLLEKKEVTRGRPELGRAHV